VPRPAYLLLVLTIAAAATATWLFPRAFPILAIQDRITRDQALQRADSFIVANDLAPDSARRGIQFTADDSLRTFIELAGGGKDSLDALLRGRDVALYSWSVRAFVPGEVSEVRLRLSPDGRLLAVSRLFPDSLVRPTVDEATGRRMADSLLANWLGEPLARWRLATTSYVTRTPGGRVDRTFTYERTDRRVANAPLRADVVIAGDLPAQVRPYVLIPESFGRRYGEMRSANELLSLLSMAGILGLMVAAMVSLRRYARQHIVRWRAPVVIGAVSGALVTIATLNQLPSTWMLYDTAGSPGLHELTGIVLALMAGGGTVLLLTLTLAAAEALTRQAFPWHLDWWKYWRYRGTREVAMRVGGGYAAAALGFVYVTTFYFVARGVLGWWVPSELIDDPNQIATRLPWVAGIGLSLQAAVSEEALFRAIPLSLIALWTAGRQQRDRDRWMAVGVVATALLFGFAHSSYPSWPPYSRGVEIFLEACVWGFLFLRFGILVPVIAHFVYDLVLFGLFAAAGTAVQYRVSSIILLVALASPALSVAFAVWRQRGWVPLGTDAWFQGWSPTAPVAEPVEPVAGTVRPPAARRRLAAFIIAAVAILVSVQLSESRIAGPAFTAPVDRVHTVTDSMVRSRGVDPSTWRRLTSTARDTQGNFRSFLRRHDAESLATTLAGTYAIPAWWIVRYVRPEAPLAERTEEWRARVFPDGRPLDLRHVISEAEPRDSTTPEAARRVALAAIDSVGFQTEMVREVDFVETPRPSRRDFTVTFVDTSVVLPDAATARVSVSLAGSEVISVRRAVQLPQAFLRQARGEFEKTFAFAGLVMLPAVALLIWGMVRSRRLPLAVPDDLTRRSLVLILVVAALSSAASSLLGLPSALALYDTAVPWRTFLTGVAGTQLVSLVGVFVLAAFWLLANGMRRRAAIPLIAGGAGTGKAMSDDLVAGLALGGIPVVTRAISRSLQTIDMPAAPQTALDSAAPVLTRVLEVIPGAIAFMLAISIPALALYTFSSRRSVRWAVSAVFLLLLATAVIGFRSMDGTERGIASAVWALVSGGLFILGIVYWGRVSVLAWVLAALFANAIGNLSFAIQAPTAVERASGLSAMLLAIVLIAAGNWLSGRHAQRAEAVAAV
jgi:hypothetical protein